MYVLKHFIFLDNLLNTENTKISKFEHLNKNDYLVWRIFELRRRFHEFLFRVERRMVNKTSPRQRSAPITPPVMTPTFTLF